MRLAILLAITTCVAGAQSKRAIEFSDLPRELLSQLESPIMAASTFDRLRVNINRETTDRVRRGEQEALAYFILQSQSFTTLPRIEPAVSARTYGRSSGPVPDNVRARIRDFLSALKQPAVDERLRHFASRYPSAEDCLAAYEQAVQFLNPQVLPVNSPRAAVYQTRGFSTDTRLEANIGVLAALDAIRAKAPEGLLNRILIVGPGLEFAPRSGLRDLPPQSFQPYILLDALLHRGMAEANHVAVDCVDVNPQVIRFIQEFPQRRPLTLIMPGVDAAPNEIGNWRGQALEVRQDMAARVSAQELNIITERVQPAEQYDLVVATNVLVYFNSAELALALANIHAMLRPGGWFVHNESRAELERYARTLDLPAVETKMVPLLQDGQGAATDVFVIHRKR
jgi:SAM-dependent methyltransferase